jgi:hypothetical protein
VIDLARTCPACGVDNRSSRELCGGCGADLDTGEVPPRPTRRDPPQPRDRRRGRRWRPGRLLVGLVAAVVVAGGLLLALTLLGLGPFASDPAVPDVDFDEAAYPDEPGVLDLSDVATRTTASDAAADAPAAMADGDPATAWRSESGVGEVEGRPGETIDLVLREAGWVERIVLRNGDQAEADAYAASDRLRRVRIGFDGDVVVLVDLLDLGLGRQEIVLPEPVLTTVTRIDVLETFPGETGELALSEIALHGWTATAEDADVATERAEASPVTGLRPAVGVPGRSGQPS